MKRGGRESSNPRKEGMPRELGAEQSGEEAEPVGS